MNHLHDFAVSPVDAVATNPTFPILLTVLLIIAAVIGTFCIVKAVKKNRNK